MGRLIDKRDNLEADLEDIIDKINYFKNSCDKWCSDLYDVYHDENWLADASKWLTNELRVAINWLNSFIEWSDHFIDSLQKIYDGICRVYDKYTEEDLNSTPRIEGYLDRAYKRCNIAFEWYDIAVEIYENFGTVLSGKYDWDVVSRTIKRNNQLLDEIGYKEDEYDENSDHFWIEK